MPNYRRLWIKGGTYFFTVVSHNRRPIFYDNSIREFLRRGVQYTRQHHPFESLAWVLLPDHLHTVWVLPGEDDNYAIRWMLIKSYVTKHYSERTTRDRGTSLWQPRYWEHLIKNEEDLKRHCDYIHFNPLKHGLVKRAQDWPWSTFMAWARRGEYQLDWDLEPDLVLGQEWD